MSNKDFYFKVKSSLKKDVKVTSTATVQIPLVDQFKQGDWSHGFGIPYNQSEPKDFSLNIDQHGGDISKAILAQAGFGTDVYSIVSTSATKTKAINKTLRRSLTAEKMYQDQHSAPVSFLAIYKSWDPSKFTDFILETLVGKALTQALLYNYFGYPVSNIGRVSGRSGYAPNGELDEDTLAFPPGSQTLVYSTAQQMGLLPDFGSATNDSIDVSSFDFNTSVYNFNDLLVDTDTDEDIQTPDIDLRITQNLAGSFGLSSATGNTFSVVYSNSKTDSISPTNINQTMSTSVQDVYQINYFEYKYSDSAPWDYMAPLSTASPFFESGKENINFDAPDQNLTATHAKMFMPSLQSSVYPSLSGLMGGENGSFTTKWYHGEDLDNDDLEKHFKYSNLVSSLKLVPPGIDPSQVQDYLDNPHKTLNEITKNIFKFVMHTVPRNVRYAGPKPTTKEPGTDSMTGDTKPEACEDISIADKQDINRVMTGSFFELNSLPPVIGRSEQDKENYLGASNLKLPGDDSLNVGLDDVVRNVLWGKGISSLFKYNRPENYGNDPARYLYSQSSTKMPSDIKEYSYKFGLHPTNYIGVGNPLGLADDVPGALEARKFAAIPRSTGTIKSMIDSLPDYTRSNSITVSEESSNHVSTASHYYFDNDLDNSNPLEVTRYITSLWLMYHFGSIPVNFYAEEGILKTTPLYNYSRYYPFVVDLHAHGGSGGKGIYADMIPLIFDQISKDPSILKYLPPGNINQNTSALSDLSSIKNPENHFLSNFEKFFGDFRDVGEDATGTLFNVGNILGNSGTSVFIEAKNDVPYNVHHKSPLIFPVWDYGSNINGHSTPLDSIVWPKLINQNSSKGLNYAEEDSPWIPYIGQNPLLLNKQRKCIPDWCKRLQVYPSVEKEQMSYGLVNPDFKLKNASIYHGENHVLTNKYLNDSTFDINGNKAPANFPTNGHSLNYKDEHLSLYEKARPFITIDYVYDTDIALGDNLQEDSTYGTDFNAVTEDYRKGDGSSEYYRNLLLSYASLTYAVDLEIDETKLIIDMLRHGVFALAGESDDYKEAGLDLDEIFAVAGEGGLYSQSLLQDYEVYKKTIAGTLQSVDFSEIPSFLKGPNVTEEMLLAVDQQLPVIKSKYESLKNKEEDIYAATSYILVNQGAEVSPSSKSLLRVQPGLRSKSLGLLPNFTVVKVLKQWVNGMGDYNFVRVVDPDSDLNGVEGYIETVDLVSINDNTFFSQVFSGEQNGNLKLAKLEGDRAITQMTEGQKVTIPTWFTNEVPYYHREAGEYWYAVELEDTCVLSRADLNEKTQQALKKGVEELFTFYNKLATQEQIDKFIDTYLTSEIADYHIDLRPGENVKFFLKVGAIYLEAFPPAQKSLDQLKNEAKKILTVDTRYYINHLVQATYGLNQMYLDIIKSDFRVQGINFALEAERLDRIPVLFKKLISFNGYSITSEEQNLIQIGFDENFNITFVSYNEGTKENNEKLLTVGFEYIRQQEPFNVKNTMSLFFHHRQLNNPLLKWQQAIKEIFLDPKPQIIPKDQATQPDVMPIGCKLPKFALPSWQELLGPIAAQLDGALQLDPRFDLGSFQFSLTDYLPPCPKPPTGKGGAYFRGEVETEAERLFFDSFESLSRMKDLQTGYKEYVGDFMSSAEGLRQIGENVVDLNDLWNNVLRKVGGLDAIYNKICRCFVDLAGLDEIEVPNFKVDLQGPSAGLNIKPLSYISPASSTAPSDTSITGGVKNDEWNEGDEYEYDTGSFGSTQSFKNSFNDDPAVFDAKDLICSFCFEIPSFFLRLPTTNVLDFLTDALLKALEYILAQLLIDLFATLLELLLRCPELTCPEGVRRVVDYGSQDLNNIIASPGIGPSPKVFVSCGIVVEENSSTSSDIQSLLDEISQSLSSGEVLELLDGSMSLKLSKIVQSKVNRYPSIASQIPNTAKLRDFFRCIGLKVPPEKLAKIEDDIIKTYENPDACDNLFEQAKAQLKNKCGDLEDKERLIKAATEIDIDNYIKLANLIRKFPDLTQQIPSLFSDDKGNKGILSGLPNPTIDYAVEQTIINMFGIVETSLGIESENYTNPESDVMIKADKNRKILTGDGNPMASLFYSPLFPNPTLPAWALVVLEPDLSKNVFYSLWFPIKDKMAPYTEDFNGNNKGDDKYLMGIDDILTDFASNAPSYLSFTAGNNITLNVDLPDFMGDRVRSDLSLSPPDKDENDNLIYTNNIDVSFDASQIIDQPFSLTAFDENSKKISESLQQSLNKYPLQSEDVPPQIQYFSQLMVDKSLPSSEEIGKDKYDNIVKSLLPIFQEDVYKSVFSSILTGIAETIGNSELLKSYNVDLFDDLIEVSPVGAGIVLLLKSLWEGVGVNVRADTDKKEMALLNLKPSKTNKGFLKGLIDTEVVANKVKKNYDFANYEDPNSDELGMTHYAMMEGIVSAYIQIISADTLLRGLPTISKFPKFLLTNGNMLQELILKVLTSDLEEGSTEGLLSSPTDFKFMCMTLLSRRSSFTFTDPKATEPGNSGSILEKKTGKIFEINSADDATRFMIRENIGYPLDFIFSKISSFGGSGQNFTGISQTNPLDLISYKYPVYVHDSANNASVDDKPASDQPSDGYDYPSSLFDNSRYQQFLNGKFFNQVYYEIEDWASSEEAGENEGIYVEDLVNRPNKLKKILSQDNLFELISLMSGQQNLGFEDGSGDGILTLEENTGPAFITFFKSIKLGTRLCYGFITSDKEYQGSSSGIAGFENVQETIKPYSDGQFETFKTISIAIDESLGIKLDDDTNSSTFSQIDDNMKEYIELNKSILILEGDTVGMSFDSGPISVTVKNTPLKTYIFPLIESTIDVMDNDTPNSFEVFNETTQEVAKRPENIREFLFESYGISLISKNLTNIVLSDEYAALLQYSFPTRDIIDMFAIFNVALVSSDRNVKHAFSNTKNVLKTLFNSIYDMTGPEKYKKLSGPRF